MGKSVLFSINSKSPVVEMFFDNYLVSLKLMVDTGAGPSLLKISKKPNKSIVFKNKILELKGITKESINSCGKTPLIFRDVTLYFHLVPDDFPIKEDGLIGSEMLSKYKAKINYEESFLEIASHVINLRSVSNVNCLRPINKGSVNLTQADRCTETQSTMWGNDRNCANARNSTAVIAREKSSIAIGECSSLNVYSNLHVSHENAHSINYVAFRTNIMQSTHSAEETPGKIDLKRKFGEFVNLRSNCLGKFVIPSPERVLILKVKIHFLTRSKGKI